MGNNTLRLYPTVKDFFTAAHIDTILPKYKEIPRKQLIASNGIKLGEIDAIYKPETAINFITIYLIRFSEMININESSKLNEYQMKLCASNILERCNGITIPELALMFKYFSQGRYGKFYGNMDIMAISQWADEYMKERGEIIIKNPEIRSFIMKRDQNVVE